MSPASINTQSAVGNPSTRQGRRNSALIRSVSFAAIEAIRQQFDMSGTRYFQILNDLIDRPEALAADPLLVKRLRRMRSSRQKARAARNLGMRLD